MAQALQSATEATDPRILRSRRMLMDALARLLKRKKFEDISVQEIADEATLNRNTFYLHYPDKTALLLAMTESRFRDLIEQRGISFTDCTGALRAVALGVCDYLTDLTNCPVKGALIPLEGSIIPVIEGMFHGRCCSSCDRARYRSSTDRNHGGLGGLRSRAPLASDPQSHPGGGDGRQD